MDEAGFKRLLRESESDCLDFKRDPYPFQGASDEAKSEILKDILAFSNAWRRTNAYILIGVDASPGNAPQVVGISTFVDDASLQQFVNSKTNRPVLFSYSEPTVEGKKVGVFEIPVQERPLYCKKDFGKVKAHVVYVRRGSSTAVADPDEVSDMGKDYASSAEDSPSVALCLYDQVTDTPMQTSTIELHTTVLEPPGDEQIMSFFEEKRIPGTLGWHMPIIESHSRPHHAKEVAEWLWAKSFYAPVSFALFNPGRVAIHHFRAEAKCAIMSELQMQDGPFTGDLVKRPLLQRDFTTLLSLPQAVERRTDLSARENHQRKRFEVSLWARDVYPGECLPIRDRLFVGSSQSDRFVLSFHCHAENLQNSTTVEFALDLKVVRRLLSLAEISQNLDS